MVAKKLESWQWYCQENQKIKHNHQLLFEHLYRFLYNYKLNTLLCVHNSIFGLKRKDFSWWKRKTDRFADDFKREKNESLKKSFVNVSFKASCHYWFWLLLFCFCFILVSSQIFCVISIKLLFRRCYFCIIKILRYICHDHFFLSFSNNFPCQMSLVVAPGLVLAFLTFQLS
jgi:hypothetical protein